MTNQPSPRTSAAPAVATGERGAPRASGAAHPMALLEATVEVVGAPFTVLIDAAPGEVVAGGFCPTSELVGRLEPGDRGERSPAPDDHPVVVALRAYDGGTLDAIDAIGVRQTAPPFRREVQAALRRIRPGTTLTYSELAHEAGRPSAVRAAASGCATNLVALIVPCHRVLRRDGGLGGYAYGEPIKDALLRHENARSAPTYAAKMRP